MQSGYLSFWEAAFAGEKGRGAANFPVSCCTYLVRQSTVLEYENEERVMIKNTVVIRYECIMIGRRRLGK